MNPPDFWYGKTGTQEPWQARLLAPCSALYDLIGQRRIAGAQPWRAPVPVICVGNLTVGGAGKTPIALALAERLLALTLRPVFLTRGYGGREKGPIRVDPAKHMAEDVGDEPLLLAQRAPTIVARDRVAGAKIAAGLGDVIIMDDGFQNPSLAKDLSLLVVDAHTGFGNARIFPAGPLRESVAAGLKRADAIILLGHEPVPAAISDTEIPIIRGSLVPDPAAADGLRGRRIAAFAGIGRPEKFFQTLRGLGAHVVFATPFADHHGYREEEIASLKSHAGKLKLVTTEKDFVRLKPGQRQGIETLPVSVDFEIPARIDALLERFRRADITASEEEALDRASH
jgi:tetraacyldisaccharide 4'-kinase